MIGRPCGTVLATRGGLIETVLAGARVGDGVLVGNLPGQIVAVCGEHATVAPLGALEGIGAGLPVVWDRDARRTTLGAALFGRAVDARGGVIDGGPPIIGPRDDVTARLAPPRKRTPPKTALWTGIPAIDGPLTLARGARVGIFGPPGCGKSSLLGALATHVDADAVVVALVGERGREAERWVSACDARTTVVCATAERSAAERVRAAEVAFAHAARLRSLGCDVVLIVDSLARVAQARRELALAVGEPVGRGGWPPSALAFLARLLESAGAGDGGSVSVIATVLCDGGDAHDPLAEAARSFLDGHLILAERLAGAGKFPALDLPASASRTFADVAGPEHRRAAAVLRAAVGALDESRDAREAGLAPGSAFLARAVAAEPAVEAFLRRPGPIPAGQTLRELAEIADRVADGRPG